MLTSGKAETAYSSLQHVSDETYLLRLLIGAVLASMAVSHHILMPRDLHCCLETAPEG